MWIGALVGAVLVAVYAGTAYLTWIPIVLGASVLLTFAIQLALRRKEGLVDRIIASVGGSLAILAIATAVLAVVRPAGLVLV